MQYYNYSLKQMIEKYNVFDDLSAKRAVREIMQEITLCGLSRSNFFHEVAFYGGTCLRIFFNLKRFSEDLDFTQNMPYNYVFDLSKYKSYIDNEFASLGLNATFEVSLKAENNNIKRGYVKGNTKEIMESFCIDKKFIDMFNHNDTIKIKVEVDSNPPIFAGYDVRFGLMPYPYGVKMYDIESLFAGKISAVLCRGWKNRIKGRDLYDYVFYLKNNIKVNLKCVENRIMHDGIYLDHELTIEELREMLCNKFDLIDYENAKEDLRDYIDDRLELNVWNADFFKSITQKLEASEKHAFILCSDEELDEYANRIRNS